MPRPVCLVCEDEILIGLDVEACLDQIGVSVAGPFASVADALTWTEVNKPDVAVLDYKLRDGECTPLVNALREHDVPIVIHSGWRPDEADTPPVINGLPWISKPLDCNTLLKAVAAAAPSIVLPECAKRPPSATRSASGRQIFEISQLGVPLTQVMIRRLKSLGPLSEAAAPGIVDAVIRTFTVRPSQDIVVSDTRQNNCHVLLGGMAAAYKRLSEGKRQIVRFAMPGDFLDLDGFVGGAMDHSISALSPCTVGVIPHQALLDLMHAHPDIAQALWRLTLADAAVFREWVVNVGQRNAQERIAHLICEVVSRLTEVGLAIEISGNRTFSWHLTQNDLADATGMSTVHVNRSLQELRARGLVEVTRDKVTIYDWFGLKTLADFKAGYLSVALQDNRAAAQKSM